eukprot:s8552_g2.t1
MLGIRCHGDDSPSAALPPCRPAALPPAGSSPESVMKLNEVPLPDCAADAAAEECMRHMESHVHDELDTLEERAGFQRRLRLCVGTGLALAGLVLTCIGVAVWVLPIKGKPTLGASQCVDDSAGEEPPLAWTGKKAGPLERQLGVITPAQAAWIVLQAGQTANDVATQTAALSKELAAVACLRFESEGKG